MTMTSIRERRAQGTMRVVTGSGGLLLVSLVMAAMSAQAPAQSLDWVDVPQTENDHA